MNQIRIFQSGKQSYDLDYTLNGRRHTLDSAGTGEKSLSHLIVSLLEEYGVRSYVFLESYSYEDKKPVSRRFLRKVKRRICKDLDGIEVTIL